MEASLYVSLTRGFAAVGEIDLAQPLFKIGYGAFEQSAVAGVAAALELFNHAAQGQAKALFLAEAGRGFLCQARLSGCRPGRCLILLRFNTFAFPAPGHRRIITSDDCD